MNRLVDWIVLLGLLAVAAFVGWQAIAPDDEMPPAPQPVRPAPAPPQPCPPDKPCPPKKPRPWGPQHAAGRRLPLAAALGLPFGAKVAGPKFDDGAEISCDYPGDRHRRNTASKGLGLCVFTSIHHSADWQDVPQLLEMPRWMIEKGIAGGGYPSKVTQLIMRLCQERGMPVPDYLQVESNDLEVLRMACESGRMPCVTYSVSPTGRYGGGRISHMVNLPHMDATHAVVLDNNYPGENAYEWMTHAEFLRAYSGGGTGWAVIFLDPPPPMPPHNGGAAPPAPKREREPVPAPQQQQQQPPATQRPAKTCPCSEHCTCGCNEGRPCRCGNPPPPARPPARPDPATTGVEWGRIVRPRYRHGEYEVTREDAVAALSVAIPPDGARRRVTVIGPQKDREKVAADWKADPALAAVKDAYVFRTYDPGHWHVSKYGFKTDGRPTVYVQEPDGKVLHRQDDYGGGAAALATTLRRLRPDYDPSKDGGGGLLGGGRSGKFPWGAAAFVGVSGGALYLLTRRPKRGVS